MKYTKSILFLVLTFSLALSVEPEVNTTTSGELDWISIQDAETNTKKKPKKIIIDLYTDWCGWCKVMDKKTFSNSVIQKYLGEKYYAVKFDAEQKEEITFNGHTFKFVPQGQRGYHELAAALTQGKLSFPTLIFLDEELGVIQAIPGYKTPQDLERIMKFFGEDAYKKQSWQDFNKGFKSEL